MSQNTPQPIILAGRYRLLEVLASGGMATVYLARQRGKAGFARTVAVKRMHPHFATETEFRALFIDEARLAARIVHPNVVQTLDVIEDDNELFIVMEYVRGLPLAQIQKLAGADGVPIDVACHVMVGALQGLQAAHQAKDEAGRPLQIVHRDVSPQNILIGSDGVARLIDFGVAKAVSQLHTTREGEIRGKLAYMAPEQVKGGVADPQTDVFSAAVVLWQLLAGKRLFVGANDGELIYRVLEHRIAPPSEFRRSVPRELDSVVLTGLSRDRALRYKTALDFLLDLERWAPVTSQRVVAAWVEDVAHEVLKDRSAALSSLLEQASMHDDPDTAGNLAATPGMRISQVGPPPAAEAEGTQTLPLGVAVAKPAAEPTASAAADATTTDRVYAALLRARRRRPVWAALFGVALVMLIGAISLASGGSDEAPSFARRVADQVATRIGRVAPLSAAKAAASPSPDAVQPADAQPTRKKTVRSPKPSPPVPTPTPKSTSPNSQLYKRE